MSEDGGCSPEDMEAWMKLNSPNEEHEFLKRAIGDWTVKGQFWMAPDAPPMETDGTSKHTMLLGGRYLEQQYSSEFAGSPFEGRCIGGYDCVKKAHVTFWIDSMSTGFCIMEGQREGDVVTTFGSMPSPDGSGEREVKAVSKLTDGELTYEMFDKRGDDWVRTMAMVYTKA